MGDYHAEPVVVERQRDATFAWVKTYQCRACGEIWARKDKL